MPEALCRGRNHKPLECAILEVNIERSETEGPHAIGHGVSSLLFSKIEGIRS